MNSSQVKDFELVKGSLLRSAWLDRLRDSSAQNHFGPRLLGPNRFFYWDSSARDFSAQLYKYFICGIQRKINLYLVCYYFNIRFSTIGKRNVKKGKHIFIQTNVISISRGTSRPVTLQLIFTIIDFSSYWSMNKNERSILTPLSNFCFT